MCIIHYQRRPREHANHSLEFIFEDVRSRLKRRSDIRLAVAPRFSNGFIPRLAIISDVRKYARNIIHITGDINFAVLGAYRNSAVLTILDCGFVNRSGGVRRSFLKTFWLDLPVWWSRYVTTISSSARDEIIALTNCNPEKIIVVPVAISMLFRYTPQTFNPNRPRVLLVGTAPNKNLERTLNAFAGIECELVIIGVILDKLKKVLEFHSLNFENYYDLTQVEVVAQYQQADLVCFASTYEGFGMPILEAQATGRPVITSNVSSMPEVAGGAAHLVDPFDVASIRDGIRKVIDDADYREMLIRRGLENVKRFDPDVIANQYLELYRRCADELGQK